MAHCHPPQLPSRTFPPQPDGKHDRNSFPKFAGDYARLGGQSLQRSEIRETRWLAFYFFSAANALASGPGWQVGDSSPTSCRLLDDFLQSGHRTELDSCGVASLLNSRGLRARGRSTSSRLSSPQRVTSLFCAGSPQAGSEGADAADKGESDGGVFRRVVAAGLRAEGKNDGEHHGEAKCEQRLSQIHSFLQCRFPIPRS